MGEPVGDHPSGGQVPSLHLLMAQPGVGRVNQVELGALPVPHLTAGIARVRQDRRDRAQRPRRAGAVRVPPLRPGPAAGDARRPRRPGHRRSRRVPSASGHHQQGQRVQPVRAGAASRPVDRGGRTPAGCHRVRRDPRRRRQGRRARGRPAFNGIAAVGKAAARNPKATLAALLLAGAAGWYCHRRGWITSDRLRAAGQKLLSAGRPVAELIAAADARRNRARAATRASWRCRARGIQARVRRSPAQCHEALLNACSAPCSSGYLCT